MSRLTCVGCRNFGNNLIQRRGAMVAAARTASRRDHPRYVEAANKAKADYIRAREDQMAHAETCAAAVSA